MDRLTSIFVQQHDLQTESFNVNFQRMLPADRIAYIKEMKLALEAELQEALDETGWKSWATSRHINREAYLGELVDVLHFWVNMVLVLGDDPEHLAHLISTMYDAKRQRNAQRQADGYDGISGKCPWCARALDDPGVSCTVARSDSAGIGTHGTCAQYGVYSPSPRVAMKPITP